MLSYFWLKLFLGLGSRVISCSITYIFVFAMSTADDIEREEPGNLVTLGALQAQLLKPNLHSKLRNDDAHRLTIMAWFTAVAASDVCTAVAVSFWDRVAGMRGWNVAGGSCYAPKREGHLSWPAKDEALTCLYLAMKVSIQRPGDEEPNARDEILRISGAYDFEKKDQWRRIEAAEVKAYRDLNSTACSTSHLSIAMEIAESAKAFADADAADTAGRWAGLEELMVESGITRTRHSLLIGYLVELALVRVPSEVYAAPAVALATIATSLAMANFPVHPIVPRLRARLTVIRETFASKEIDALHWQQLEDALLALWRRETPTCFVVKKWLLRAGTYNFVAMLAPPAVAPAEQEATTPKRRIIGKATPPSTPRKQERPPATKPLVEPPRKRGRPANTMSSIMTSEGGARRGPGRPPTKPLAEPPRKRWRPPATQPLVEPPRKRGRPANTMSSTMTSGAGARRGPGRPPAKPLAEPPRKRGRPPAAKPLVEPPRKRGRPANTMSSTMTSGGGARRGPGQPPTKPLAEAPRKRGRPSLRP